MALASKKLQVAVEAVRATILSDEKLLNRKYWFVDWNSTLRDDGKTFIHGAFPFNDNVSSYQIQTFTGVNGIPNLSIIPMHKVFIIAKVDSMLLTITVNREELHPIKCWACDRNFKIKCTKCNVAKYCSTDCHNAAWSVSHEFVCKHLTRMTTTKL